MTMLDIKWAMEQLGIPDETTAISILGKLDKFNYGCLSCGSSHDLRYTEIGEILCKECRDELCCDDDGLLDYKEFDEVFAIAFAEVEEEEWLDDNDEIS